MSFYWKINIPYRSRFLFLYDIIYITDLFQEFHHLHFLYYSVGYIYMLSQIWIEHSLIELIGRGLHCNVKLTVLEVENCHYQDKLWNSRHQEWHLEECSRSFRKSGDVFTNESTSKSLDIFCCRSGEREHKCGRSHHCGNRHFSAPAKNLRELFSSLPSR